MKKLLVLLLLWSSLIQANQMGPADTFFTPERVEAYHGSISHQAEYAFKRLLSTQFLANAKSVLDIGCGDGAVTALLAKQMPEMQVQGCDLSKEMIKFAATHYLSPELPNLSFSQKDAMNLEFSNEFDRIISINSLHWTQDQKRVLQGIYASLKTGGKAMIVVAPQCSEDDFQGICKELIDSEKWKSAFADYHDLHTFHNETEYRTMASEAQLAVDKIQTAVNVAVFPNRSSLEVLLKSVLTPLYHLPESQRASFLDALFASLKAKGRIDDQGRIHLHVAQMELLLSKK